MSSFRRSIAAVAWSFFGVRRRADLERDAASIRPWHLIVAALLLAGAFIGGLLLVVDAVVGRGPGA